MRMPPPPARAGHPAGFCFVAARAVVARPRSAAAGDGVSITTAEAAAALGISVAAAPSALQRARAALPRGYRPNHAAVAPHAHRARRGSALHDRGALLSGAASRRLQKCRARCFTAAHVLLAEFDPRRCRAAQPHFKVSTAHRWRGILQAVAICCLCILPSMFHAGARFSINRPVNRRSVSTKTWRAWRDCSPI